MTVVEGGVIDGGEIILVEEKHALMQKLGYAVRFEGTGETRRAVTTPLAT